MYEITVHYFQNGFFFFTKSFSFFVCRKIIFSFFWYTIPFGFCLLNILKGSNELLLRAKKTHRKPSRGGALE